MYRTVPITVIIVGAGSVAMGIFLLPEPTRESLQAITISAVEFKQKKEQDPGMVIEVRTLEEFEDGHLAAADLHYNLLNGDFEAHLDSLDRDETYYLYCRSCSRSGRAAQLMVEHGFSHVYNIGGFQDLVDAGLESN